MKIESINLKPLKLPLRQPYHWAQGVRDHFAVNLIEICTADGVRGYGECTVAPDQAGVLAIMEKIKSGFEGESVYDIAPLRERFFQQNYSAFGANLMRAANQIFSGFDMSIWDLQGKLAGVPVWSLFGGSHRDQVGYFFFLQGDTPQALARHAAEGVAAGERVFYLKVGREESRDLEIVAAVRQEIGNARLRLDANEAWDPYQAIRMCKKLERYDIDFIEQPTPCWSIDAMRHVRESVGIPVVADQAAFTLYDVYEICRQRAADMICIGPREIGGLQPMMKAAAVAESAGLRICIHSSFTTGITTCAEHHVARAIPNLDDGNQIMWQLARDNIVSTPELAPRAGWLALADAPGLGFEIDTDIVADAHARYRKTQRL